MTNSTACVRQRLRHLYEKPRKSPGHIISAVLHLVLIVACVVAWDAGLWPVTVLLWFAIAWMNHAALSRLHEAAHRMLFRSRIANEITGILIGTLALTPLSVYRYVHSQHHAHLGREKDPEFWPYNQPGAPRWLRLTYALLELSLGWIFTPWLYSVRTARAWTSLSTARRKRLLAEWVILAGSWTLILLAVGYTSTWTWFLIGFLAPAWMTGTLQTIRKFTEHLGRFGETIEEMTRTVVYSRRFGRAASCSQLHVELHGTHHRWPRIPFHKLPQATRIVCEELEQSRTYPNHLVAICDMLPHLLDPKLGPQWDDKSTTPFFEKMTQTRHAQ